MASPLTVYADASDGRAYGLSTDYSIARSTGSTYGNTSASQTSVGQYFVTPNYRCYQSFYAFNTSGIGAGQEVSIATFALFASDITKVVQQFTVQARIYNWGGTLTEGNFRSGNPSDANSIDEYTLVASVLAGDVGEVAYTNLTSEAAFLSNISMEGTTYLFTNSSKQLDGTAPTADDESVATYYAEDTGTTRDPRLYVEYSAASTLTIVATQVGANIQISWS